MEVKEGGIVIYNYNIKGDHIEDGGLKIVNGGEKCRENHDDDDEPVSEKELERKLDFIRTRIDTNRLWFPVCRYLMWHGFVAEGDFTTAVKIIEKRFPDLKLNAKDMNALYCLSFTKPLGDWDSLNAPVKGRIFNKYYGIAQLMECC